MIDPTLVILIGTVLTASVSIVAILVNYYSTRRTLRHGTALDIGKVSLELKMRQLNELYGPLLFLVEQNRRLAMKLREGKGDPDKWRLLDHITDVLGNPQDRAIVDLIVDIDAKVENLIISKAGLVHAARPPESFELFLGHYKVLKLALEGKETPKVREFEYYPRNLNEDVKKAFETIKKEIDGTLVRYESILIEELE
jgi:hypothetical protein